MEREEIMSSIKINRGLGLTIAILSLALGAFFFFQGAACFAHATGAGMIFTGIAYFLCGVLAILGGILYLLNLRMKEERLYVLAIFSYIPFSVSYFLVYLVQGFSFIGSDNAYFIWAYLFFSAIAGAAAVLAVLALFFLNKWDIRFEKMLIVSSIAMIAMASFFFVANYMQIGSKTTADAIEGLLALFPQAISIAIPSIFLAFIMTSTVTPPEEVKEGEDEERSESADSASKE